LLTAHATRIFRILALSLGLYSAGYASGMHDYIRDANRFNMNFIRSV
jgi:hypothetical protein